MAPTTKSGRHTLRNGLRAVGAIGVLLAVTNFGWHVWLDVEHGREAIQQAAQRLATNTSARIGYEVNGAEALLARFLGEIRRPDRAENDCSKIAARMMREATGYLNLGFVDADGYVVCSAVETQGRVFVGDRPYIQKSIALKAFVAGGIQVSRTTGKLSLNYALPLVGPNGEVEGVAVAAGDIGFLQEQVASLVLPNGSTAYLIDAAGIVLARAPPEPGTEGSGLGVDPAATSDLIARGTATLELAADGSMTVLAYATPFTVYADRGIFFVLTISEQTLWDQATRNVNWLTVLLSLLILIAAIAIWVIGAWAVIGPIRRLVASAERLGRGDLGERLGPPYDENEVGTLQRTFDEMSAAIQEREARLLEAQRRAKLTYWEWRLGGDGGIDWSPEAPAILGVAPELLPQSDSQWLLLVHPDDKPIVDGAYDAVRSGGAGYDITYRLRHPNGSIAWVRDVGEIKRSPAEGDRRLRGIMQDVTVLVEAQRSRNEVEGRLRAFMDHAPFVMYVKGLDGRYLVSNAEHERVFGRPDRPVMGSVVADLCPPEMASLITEHDATVLDSGQPVIRERTYGGFKTYNHVMAVKFPVRGEDGSIIAIGGFEIDIGERKRVEEQLFRAQKMEAIGQLTGGLAHDFNNICGVIIGNLDLLQEKVAIDADLSGLVKEALDATLRGAELNRQLLAFSRRQPLHPKIIDVRETIERMSKILKRTLGEAITVRTLFDPAVWPIRVDAAQLEAAVLNLAVNARDAMPGGGTLTIEIGNSHLDKEYVARYSEVIDGDFVKIAASDTGTGMPPEALERAFEPFFTTKGAGKGTGLGLAMVHGFVKQSGGHATIYSEKGHGTTVKLYFPRAPSGQDRKRESEPEATETGAGQTILVVEDNDGLRRIAQRQLRELGYRTIEAGNAQEGLTVLRGDASIDLLLTDVVMPGGMDGRALAAEARRLRPGLKVLFTSGFTEAAATAQAPEFIDRLLTKPYRKADLAGMVRRVLESA
ncbi:MAG: ATP-binding protein [Alphaproteobacteria bacterium]